MSVSFVCNIFRKIIQGRCDTTRYDDEGNLKGEKFNFICKKSTKLTINWQSLGHFYIKHGW